MLSRTQIGGKYDKEDTSLFELKSRLQEADVEVTYPASDGIVRVIAGRGYTFDPTETSFFEVESDYYRSLAESDFHTVNNRFLRRMGYIGASAALEMGYVMMHNKPILLMHPPELAPSVDPELAEVIDQRRDLFHIHDVTTMSNDEIVEIVSSFKGKAVDYDFTQKADRIVLERVDLLFQEIGSQKTL